MREGCSYTYPPLSIARYSFIQRVNWSNVERKNLPKVLTPQHRVRTRVLVVESPELYPWATALYMQPVPCTHSPQQHNPGCYQWQPQSPSGRTEVVETTGEGLLQIQSLCSWWLCLQSHRAEDKLNATSDWVLPVILIIYVILYSTSSNFKLFVTLYSMLNLTYIW